MAENKKYDVINANNFAKNSNIVFSEYLPTKQFNESLAGKEGIKVLHKVENERASFVWYVKTKFNLSENDVIFCNTELVEFLFEGLKSIKSLKNIKLITHQSDRSITKSLFNKKPDCISHWFSTNVVYENHKLTPIPIGINDFTFYNYMNEEILNKFFSNRKAGIEKEEKLYVNFNFNTNRKERINLHEFFKRKEWAIVENSQKNPKDYYENIMKYKFILCPWGNGYDTYRFWESLYLGSIPITKYHKAYSNFKEFPAIFVNDYKSIDVKLLEQKFNNLEEKLNIYYWINLINSDKSNSTNKETINYENIELNKKLDKIYKLRMRRRRIKIIKYYIYKYLNPKSYIRFFKKM